jgi:hypothetical protein
MFFIQELTLQHEGESTVVSETWTCHFSGGTYIIYMHKYIPQRFK